MGVSLFVRILLVVGCSSSRGFGIAKVIVDFQGFEAQDWVGLDRGSVVVEAMIWACNPK